MRCLRYILSITWEDRVTKEKVLATAKLHDYGKRFRWLGHVHRIDFSRLHSRRRKTRRPMLRFKDSVERNTATFEIGLIN